MEMELGHCAFQTADLARAVDFYTNKLGLVQHFALRRQDGSIWLVYLRSSSGQFIELFNIPQGEFDNSRSTYRHICMVVKSIDDAARELQAKGLQLYYGPTTMGNKAPQPFEKQMGKCGSYGFFVADPDGNQIEFHEFTEKSLQRMTAAEIQKLQPLIDSNTYVPQAAWQGAEDARFPYPGQEP